MRKITILRTLMDFVWYVSCIPLVPLMLFLIVMVFIDPAIVQFGFDISDQQLIDHKVYIPVFVILLSAIVYVAVYCFYLFRQTLRLFEKRKPFHTQVVQNFKVIGKYLITCGVGTMLLWFISRLILMSEIKIGLGLTPHITLICLGLFFMVLSEVFLIAKTAKEENELTV